MTKRKIYYNRLYGTILHELGHALKLSHSKYYDSLMKQGSGVYYITHFDASAVCNKWGG